ncbi:serine/threonine-protein phosphatase with EF-hands pef-1-like [Watersipora subatra]|uniref:serine/threonine-protein phosphatase with EF-hands pef-1-like n=1 Tax=Watersipora subatra TaxID=2589382 RepID=UPI00355B99DC
MGCLCSKGGQHRVSKTDKRKKNDPLLEKDAQIRAAVFIQKWFRKYQARLEARRRATWQVFQSLEYKNEKDQMSLYNFFNDLLLHGQGEGNVLIESIRSEDHPKQEDDLCTATDPEDITVEPSYDGITLVFPLDAGQLPPLVETFRKKQVLHAKYALQILHEARKLFKGMASWHQVPLGNLPFVTVCGDIHGQMDDLLLIFYKNGFPDRQNPYIFNGDLVDRGEQSIEVALLLFAYFLVYPKSVIINRGNHEDQVMNMRYGFVKEAMLKYQQHSAKMVKLFSDVFSWLPICSVIDKKILVCHGGISNKTNLAEIDKLDRHQYLSVLNPPQDETLPDGHPKKINFVEWRQILDMLWSDPKMHNGCEPNTFRGGGCYFGPDICNMVLKKHRFKMLIRSHECKPEGYEYCHNNQCLTIFSASNYYEEDSNKGAFIKISKDVTRGNSLPEVFQFQVKLGQSTTMSSKVNKTEHAALASLREKLYSLKGELTSEFRKHDPASSGNITASAWCDSVKSVTGLDLPWRTMRDKLVKSVPGDTNKVNYNSTFASLTLESKGGTASSELEALYKHRTTLTQIFNTIDKDRSGFISREEFIEACKKCGMYDRDVECMTEMWNVLRKATRSDMSDKQIKIMAKHIDINGDGQIDINEFLEAYSLVARKDS